jgi:acetyl-CoA acetyltransferase family protein
MSHEPQAVVVDACRTPIGTAYKGSLVNVSAFDLAERILGAAIERSGLEPEELDDVILGESLYGGGDIARHAAVSLGMSNVPGLANNRHCASGLAAIQSAAASIRAGMDQAIIAGGVQSNSTMPFSRWRVPGTDDFNELWFSPTHPDTPEAPNMDMAITVGWNTAKIAGITREEMDAWALRSHQRAIAAIDAGRFRDEIVPVEVTDTDGKTKLFDTDEHPRRDTTMDKLASLKPLHPEIPGFSITAGNSSGLNDAAAVLVIVSDDFAQSHGLEPLAVVRSWASVGVDPVRTGLAPTEAIPKALQRAGLDLEDVALFEINEAFASMCVASCRALGLDEEKVNVSGSGCSLGHPVAATGARMATTLIHEQRRRGGGVVVAAMCAGGGMGSALVLEVLAP